MTNLHLVVNEETKSPSASSSEDSVVLSNYSDEENRRTIYTKEEIENDIVKPKWGVWLYDRVLVFVAILAMVRYVIWRWRLFFTKDSDWIVSCPLIISETTLIFLGLGISYFLILHRIYRPQRRLREMGIPREDYPSVDIFIPCLNEPVEIIRATARAACSMDYPQDKMTVCICDDGKRSSVSEMCAELQSILRMEKNHTTIKYIARTKTPGVYHHAKAGNLNNAIFKEGTNGNYLLVFDCDMICKPELLECLIGHFYKVNPEHGGSNNDSSDITLSIDSSNNKTHTAQIISSSIEMKRQTEKEHLQQKKSKWIIDENLAFVQSPQSFVGVPDHDPLGQQYKYFYGPVLQGWDGAHSTPCCGTNVIFSRNALRNTGGFVYGSITEDFLTSMYLHDLKYKSKYVHEYLAHGLSPDCLHDFYKQRLRWAAGAVEIFCFHNSFFKKGLTLKQKYLYFWSGFNSFMAIPLLYVIITPFIQVLFPDLVIAPQDDGDYINFTGAFLFFNVLMLFACYRHVPKLYLARSVQESVFMLFNKISAVMQVAMKGKLKFITTNKNLDEASPLREDISHIIPHICYWATGLVCIATLIVELIFISQQNNTDQFLTDEEKRNRIDAIISKKIVPIIWMSIAMWQTWPPISVFIQAVRDQMRVKKEAKLEARKANKLANKKSLHKSSSSNPQENQSNVPKPINIEMNQSGLKQRTPRGQFTP